jgi:phenylpropionate dioxygenase-like ring-hydroxylating dioxygenase large terminal subunit
MHDFGRDDMTSVQQYLDLEDRTVPSVLRETSERDLGLEDVPVAHFTSPAHHALEMDRLWSRVWQWAANEEDLPNVGDHLVYDIGDHSIMLVRSAPETIKAFHNACLHRGTQLKTGPGRSPAITCPFHGWTWNLDGTLKAIPCRWDFPQVRDESYALREVRVEAHHGFVFLNLDSSCRPLIEHLENLPAHFDHFFRTPRFTAAHVSKVMPANWKVVLEAFIESYHVLATHPQILDYTADANTQYDVYDSHSRMITPFGVPSPHLGAVAEKEVEAAMAGFTGFEPSRWPIERWGSARKAIAEHHREALGRLSGIDFAGYTDCEMVDAIEYFVFPNFVPWGGVGAPIMYRFRPNGHDPDTCIMDVRLMPPCAPGVHMPAAPVQHLALDQPWTDAEHLGGLAAIFEQDTANLGRIQRGLKAAKKPGITLGSYQESRIRHFHQTLDRWLRDDG